MVATKASRVAEYGLTAIALTASLVIIYTLKPGQTPIMPSQSAVLIHQLGR